MSRWTRIFGLYFSEIGKQSVLLDQTANPIHQLHKSSSSVRSRCKRLFGSGVNQVWSNIALNCRFARHADYRKQSDGKVSKGGESLLDARNAIRIIGLSKRVPTTLNPEIRPPNRRRARDPSRQDVDKQKCFNFSTHTQKDTNEESKEREKKHFSFSWSSSNLSFVVSLFALLIVQETRH